MTTARAFDETATTLKLTRAIFDEMQPKSSIVYGGYSLPTHADRERFEWHHPDEQWNIALDRKTNLLTGQFYEWDEDAQDWVDGSKMTAVEIHTAIVSTNLLMVTGARPI